MDSGRGLGLEPKFWTTSESALLVDSRREPIEGHLFRRFFEKSQDFPAHIWLASSGSSRNAKHSTKLIGLSKKAILSSARSVNEHLEVTSKDRWALCLPRFHIGGLAVWARAHLLGNVVCDYAAERWNAVEFAARFSRDEISLLSLVPTQVHDIVKAQIPVPPSLRAVVVGGSSLRRDLYAQTRALGWPLLPSFGMTEASSQIATAELSSLISLGVEKFPALKILKHMECQIDDRGILGIRGPALMTGFWQAIENEDSFQALPVGDYYWTSDLVGKSQPGYIEPLGRDSEFVKILGEGLHLGQTQERFQELLGFELADAVALVAQENARTGFDLVLLAESSDSKIQDVVQQWNLKCLPVERILKVVLIDKIPRTSLGKIRRY